MIDESPARKETKASSEQEHNFTTPYLIIDDGVVFALCLAAKNGVDVRIITPHIWDKALVHVTTRLYYHELVKGGNQENRNP